MELCFELLNDFLLRFFGQLKEVMTEKCVASRSGKAQRTTALKVDMRADKASSKLEDNDMHDELDIGELFN